MMRKLHGSGKALQAKKWDVIILFSLILISFVPALLFHFTTSTGGGEKRIIVEKDGREIFSHSLEEKGQKYVAFPFEHNGKTFEGNLEIKDGSVMLHRLPEEIVPLSIHEDMGWISKSYEIIVALPIKLVIKIADDVYNEIDVST